MYGQTGKHPEKIMPPATTPPDTEDHKLCRHDKWTELQSILNILF